MKPRYTIDRHSTALRLKKLWLGMLLVLLAATQTLGLMHRSAHSPQAQSAHSLQALLNTAELNAERLEHNAAHSHADHNDHAHEHEQTQASWLAQLFAHQNGGDSCRLMDAQVCGDMAVAMTAPVFPALAAVATQAFSKILSTARSVALFDARGPPALP